LFDPIGGWWARLIADRLQAESHWHADRRTGPFLVGRSLGVRVTGGDLKFGDAWLIANIRRHEAYVVKHGFKMAYEQPHPLAEGRPLYEALGPPREDERRVGPDTYEQRFERGTLRWSPKQGTEAFLE
jgi:hypothetical protein